MTEIIVVAGLSSATFDAFSKISIKRLLPGGIIISQPVRWRGYAWDIAEQVKGKIARAILDLEEDSPVNVGLLYVDYGDDTTEFLVENFFPFALPRPIKNFAPESFGEGSLKGKRQREFERHISEEVRSLSRRLSAVRSFTQVHNLTPLLLPLRNFRSRALRDMLWRIYSQGGTSADLEDFISTEVAAFKAQHPRVQPSGSSQTCFSDSELFFQSPGRHRHGFFRHSDLGNGHKVDCLLNARSRLGGSYEHTFHFDCQPVRRLSRAYPNCHDEPRPPKAGYVNISPNDFIR